MTSLIQTIISWLDCHAGAVQAVTAVATMLLTACVARLTWRYVTLTGELTAAARQQVEIARLNATAAAALQETSQRQLELATLARDAEERRRREEVAANAKLIDGLCARLLRHYAAAPASAPDEMFFRNAPPIDDADVARLREAALRVPSLEPKDTEALLHALSVLRDLHAKTREAPAGRGYFYTADEVRMYTANLALLRERLEQYTKFRPSVQI